jgi:hypothetical protein
MHGINMANQHTMQQIGSARYNEPVPDAPQTEMSIQVCRAQQANTRLVNVHHDLIGLIGRLYGEGSAESEPKASPKAVGVLSEMSEVLGWIDGVAERLEYAAKRLSQLA